MQGIPHPEVYGRQGGMLRREATYLWERGRHAAQSVVRSPHGVYPSAQSVARSPAGCTPSAQSVVRSPVVRESCCAECGPFSRGESPVAQSVARSPMVEWYLCAECGPFSHGGLEPLRRVWPVLPL